MEILNFVCNSLQLLLLFVYSPKQMDFGSFTMETPNKWKYIEERGTDLFVGKFGLDKNDTVHFDYGRYSNSLEEDLDFSVRNDSVFCNVKNENSNDTINRYVEKFYAKRDTVDFKKLYKTEVSFEVINNLKAKIVTPKKTKIGLTGVYFENTSAKGKGMRFQISGYNLSEENQQAFLKAIRTLKFKD